MAAQKASEIKDDKENGHERSTSWPSFRRKHLGPECALCGSQKKLELHHIVPFHKDRSKELDPSNVITLCESNTVFNCHRIFGHLNNFKGWNPEILSDVKLWSDRLKKNQERVKTGVEPVPEPKAPMKFPLKP
jgi:5-methylcytosine-specific restriction protein A